MRNNQGKSIKIIFILLLAAILAACGSDHETDGAAKEATGKQKTKSDSPVDIQPSPKKNKNINTCFVPNAIKLSREERKLFKLVMKHRAKHGLPAIPVSKSLTYVAKTHLVDLNKNSPSNRRCNIHSWSNKGNWKPCCYTANHKQAKCMWSKPKELTKYPGFGYEISFATVGRRRTRRSVNAKKAFAVWKSSQHHHDIILNRAIWKKTKWKAIGLAIHKGSASIWFGERTDPATSR